MTTDPLLEQARAITDRLPAPQEIRDDWGTFIIQCVSQGVWARTGGLSRRDRSLITVAALCVLDRPHELVLHIRNGLNNGLSRAEISEIIMHMAIYGGFPVAVEGMRIAREVFDAIDAGR